MSDDLVQAGAVILLGRDPGDLTDYTCFISEFRILETRTLVVKSPSFGSPVFEDKAAAGRARVAMTFLAAPNASSGLWWELRRASLTRTGELYFDVKWSTGMLSASNPKRTGYLVVSDLDTGAAAFTDRRQSKVFPARAVSDPIAA